MPGFPLPGVAEPGWPAPGFPVAGFPVAGFPVAGSLLLVGPVFGCSAVVFTPVLLPLCRPPGRLARALKALPSASAGLYVHLSRPRYRHYAVDLDERVLVHRARRPDSPRLHLH